MTYLKTAFGSEPTQQEPIPGTNQQQNNAGGYSYVVNDWTRLRRFLILGSEKGSYYQSESQLTKENASCVLRCLQSDGGRTVHEIVHVSQNGLAPKNDQALFALALATKFGDLSTRQFAYSQLPLVARTGTHLMHFVSYCRTFRGWSRGLRRSVASWFLDKKPRDLAYQAVKYQSRDGESLRDLLRESHPKPASPQSGSIPTIIDWIAHGWPDIGADPHPDANLLPIWGFEAAKRATTSREIVKLITQFDLVREAIPTQWLKEPDVWAALLDKMPMEAMVRNLATMTRIGLLSTFSDASSIVVGRLLDQEHIRKSRMHPIKLLTAHLTYARGTGVRGSETWTPVTAITDALADSFYLAFPNVVPTGKRLVLALDVSGSMGSFVGGSQVLTCRDASAAMALVTAATETAGVHICAFTTSFIPLSISPRQRLNDAIKAVSGLRYGGTDCALPMLEFLRTGQKVDGFVVYTDNETWYGDTHPSRALQMYREKLNPEAKLAVVAMTPTQFSIADPNDAGMFDVAGFSADTPELLNMFLRGDL